MGSIAFIQSNLLVGVALANGLTIAVMASAVGHISGGHFNPAVTLGFLVTRRIGPALAALYWLAQIAGAVLGALALRALFPSEANLDTGVPVVNPAINDLQGVAIEALLTFFLVWVVFATAVDPGGAFKTISGLAIGLTDRDRRPRHRPAHGRGDEPGAGARPGDRLQHLGRLLGVCLVGPPVGAAAAALAYE